MSKRMLVLMCSIFLIVPLLFMGCRDGAAGPAGAAGATGAKGDNGAIGPPGPVTTTDESCMVCHSTGRIADISDSSTTGVHYNYKTALSELAVTIDNVVVFGVSPDNASLTRLITTITPAAGATLNLYTTSATPGGIADNTANLTYLRFAYARLAAPVSVKNTAQWVRYTSGDRTPSHLAAIGGGKYTMFTDVKTADFDATKPTRLLLLVGAAKDATSGLDTTEAVLYTYNFVPDGVTPVTLSRDVVTEAACNGCHSQNEAGMRTNGLGHEYRYTLAACVICHADRRYSVSGTDGISKGREMQTLVHRIHNAMPANPTLYNNDNWSDVTYPLPVTNCAKCHTGTANADNWKNFPSANACNTCHDTLNFTTGANHPGGPQPDANCNVCHPATGHVDPNVGASVTEAHDTSAASALHAAAKNVPEFDVTMTLSAPASGTFYATGETPTVTVTLKKHSDGTAVPGSLYTAAKHATGTAAGTSLSKASLYVYGSRNVPVPVLTKASRTFNATTGAPTQAQSLFLPSTDNQVTTSASGFSYKLDPIPSSLSGTYLVRFIAADYGYVADNNYKIDSTAFTTIQINTATVTKKIDGDSCVNCHGTGTLGAHDARHSVVFNTDECVSCHDRSGNHADAIANRVHAVHSASVAGDLEAIDWSEVTYPQLMGSEGIDRVARCVTCHSSGSTVYRSNVFESSCYGCHADGPGAIAHFQQNGGF